MIITELKLGHARGINKHQFPKSSDFVCLFVYFGLIILLKNKWENRKLLLFFYFTILYWFCHTSTWICHRCTCVPHPEPPLPPSSLYHPSGSSQCTIPKLPLSCIEPGLAIHFLYDIIHVSDLSYIKTKLKTHWFIKTHALNFLPLVIIGHKNIFKFPLSILFPLKRMWTAMRNSVNFKTVDQG